MFEAWVLACLLSTPKDCFEFQDTRGPYETRKECYERTIEMREVIQSMPDYRPQAFKCKEIVEELET